MTVARSQTQKPVRSALGHHVSRRLREALLLVLAAVAVFMMLALVTYHPQDPGWSFSAQTDQLHNAGGVVGAWFADFTLYLFGYLAYLFPLTMAYAAWLAFRWRREGGGVDGGIVAVRGVGFVVTLASGTGLAALHFSAMPETVPLSAGGVLGELVGHGLGGLLNFEGATLFALALFLGGITLTTGLSWVGLMDRLGRLAFRATGWCRRQAGRLSEGLAAARARRAERARAAREARARQPEVRTPSPPRGKPKPPRVTKAEPVVPKAPVPGRKPTAGQQIELFHDKPAPGAAPPVNLLDSPPEQQGGYSEDTLEDMSRLVETKLADFGIEVAVTAVQPGPVITRFELKPAKGVKASQITNLSRDLARSLAVISVRVIEVIPGKSVMGLEIPNEQRQLIAFSEIIRSPEYEKAQAPLTMALGQDIGGHPVVADLAKMPHLLVAGTTGSGKSVGVNAMILSLLYRNSPKRVRLIMIDPKMLELSVYDDIPHLLSPVVTDMKEAANALRWCVAEMERRYKLMASVGVRNLAGYNKKVRQAREQGEPLRDPLWKPDEQMDYQVQPEAPELEPLPFIVVVVDEFADMMMIVGKKVEELIARLAQKARAAGIHLILATQRPSVDVITGLIKANIPTRIAFQVSSRVDSRTILDQQGAEALLGHGDMLYLAPGSGLPNRVHGAFVSDQEVHRVADFIRQTGEPDYVDEVLQDTTDTAPIPGIPGEGGGDGEQDPLYDQAVAVVTETRRASISGVQRRLKIGYNRAARIVEEMEAAGVVSALQPNGAREVLAPPPPKD
ncbi:DNA translocase FtsK [Alkalilimnicola ehrlichii]|uniref:DNA translocase FtsK n=1 Tax=Alkalilimnicola ehrlichii TaxID=351052 RepID=UPI003BA31DD1